jgi:hypothetical protein
MAFCLITHGLSAFTIHLYSQSTQQKEVCLKLALWKRLCYKMIASKKGLAADAGADGTAGQLVRQDQGETPGFLFVPNLAQNYLFNIAFR